MSYLHSFYCAVQSGPANAVVWKLRVESIQRNAAAFGLTCHTALSGTLADRQHADTQTRKLDQPSMTILLLAICHAIPLVVCRIFTSNRYALVWVAILSIAVAAGLGQPAYTLIDTAAVLLGLYFVWPAGAGPSKTGASPKREAPRVAIPREPRAAPLGPAKWVDLGPPGRSKSGYLVWAVAATAVVLIWLLIA